MLYFLKKHNFLLILICFWALSSCSVQQPASSKPISLRYITDVNLPEKIDNDVLGGMSGIAYQNGELAIACDDNQTPRIFLFNIKLKPQQLERLAFKQTIKLQKEQDNQQILADVEGIAYDENNGFYLSTEGLLAKGISPGVFRVNRQGKIIKNHRLPSYFHRIGKGNNGRSNRLFESLSLAKTGGVWVANEHPLEHDGPRPQFWGTKSYVRFTHLDTTGTAIEQFAYRLARIQKLPYLPYATHGLTDIVQLAPHEFLTLERSFAAGRGKKSFRSLLYYVTSTNATQTLTMQKLRKKKLQLAQKQLLLRFDDLQKQLTSAADNLEGLCLGPKLPNGNPSLLVIADNNFNSFRPQYNQLIVFELIKN